MIRNLIYFLFLALVFAGCAGTKVVSYDNDTKTRGFITYQSEVYLWITADSSGKNLAYKFIPLPNKNKKIIIKPTRGFGSGETSFKISDGWLLTEFGSKSDSKIPETITGIAALGTAAATLFSPAKEGDEKTLLENQRPLVPGLYKILYDSATGMIIGFERISNYPLPETTAENTSCSGCSCDFEGKKYSENAIMEMGSADPKQPKALKKCVKGTWIDIK